MDKIKHIQLQLSDTAMTLKFSQGHWKGYGQVKLHEKYHHAKFDIYHINGVRENCNVKACDISYSLLAGIAWIITSYTSKLTFSHVSQKVTTPTS